MAWYTCVQTWYDFIKHFLLLTLVLFLSFLRVFSLFFRKAILFIDHFPNCWPVVICERFYVFIKIKVLSLGVFVIFHVPWPRHLITLCLLFDLFSRPFNLLWWLLYFIGFYPICWNVFLVTSTHCATFRPAKLIPYIQLTFLV